MPKPVPSSRVFEFTSPDWNAIEALSVNAEPKLTSPTQLNLNTSNGELLLEISHVGVRIRSGQQRDYDYDLICNQPEPRPLSLVSDEGRCTISDGSLSLAISYSPFAFVLSDANGKLISQSPTDGHFVRRHRVPPLAKTEQGWVFSVDLKSTEAVYGLGEKWGALNKRGQLIRSYN